MSTRQKRKIQLERRHFLQLAGASALTYPFLRGLPSYAAAGGTPPTYLILVFTPCGCVRPLWGATDGSGNDVLAPLPGSKPTITTNFKFRNTLTPFAQGGTVGGTSRTTNLQSKVTLLDGIANLARRLGIRFSVQPSRRPTTQPHVHPRSIEPDPEAAELYV